MTRQVAIGAVVGFAITVVFLSMCEVSSGPAAPTAVDAGVVAQPGGQPSAVPLNGLPLKPMHRVGEGHPRSGSLLRRSLIQSLLVDGGT